MKHPLQWKFQLKTALKTVIPDYRNLAMNRKTGIIFVNLRRYNHSIR